MFKSKQEIIVIQAEATAPLPTGVVFWSHDKGTAKLLFQLKKDTVNQTLAEGTIVPILLEFNSAEAENGRGRHIYHAVIEDALNGIVSIVLEDNILGYQGRVDGSIYIELPDSRSLDTAGRFTFDIKRSPIDENIPELEDYYWQGFGEIMEQYHESIAEIKSEAKELLDSLTADVTTAQNKVTTLEQSITTANTNLNARIDEISKKIDDNDVFTKEESSANVVYQIIGKDAVEIQIQMDFEGKIASSNVENPHRRTLYSGPTLGTLGNFSEHSGQEAYDRTSKLDGIVDTRANNGNGNMRQERMDWNIVEGLTRILGETFFSNQQAFTTVEKVRLIRKITKKINPIIYGKGSSAGGNKLSYKRRLGSWEIGGTSTTSASIVKLELPTENENTINSYIQDNGYGMSAAYAEPSDGTTLSSVIIDYACLEMTIELSMNQYINSMIAFNHIENIATEEEAEAGENNKKTMTPLRVFQAIAKWTKDKFVSKTEDETVLGAKNFKNGLQINGRNVLSQSGEKVVDHTSATDSSIQSGTVRLIRYGDFLIFNFNFQCRSSNINSGGNLIGAIEPDFIPAYSIQVSLNDNKSLTIDSSGKVTALWGLDADKYYAGSAMVLAKNKL